MSNMEKPVCGGGQPQGEYDLGLHVAGLFLVLGFSIFGAAFPIAAKRVKWLRIPPKIFFACKHFGTGVLIATAFVHLLPTAFGSLSDPCLPDLFVKTYPPITGAIMMVAMFILFAAEMYLNQKTGGHSHGGPTGEGIIGPPRTADSGPGLASPTSEIQSGLATPTTEDEKTAAWRTFSNRASMMHSPRSPSHLAHQDITDRQGEVVLAHAEMPPWFAVFYEQYVRHRIEMADALADVNTRQPAIEETQANNDTPPTLPELDATVSHEPPAKGWFIDSENNWTDPHVYRRKSLSIALLEGGILFHSVFVGMTVSLTVEGFVVLLIAILFHQVFEGLGLGARIAAVPYPRGSPRPWLLVVAFGATAPLGQAIGLAVRGSYDPSSAEGLIVVGIFNAISSGLLIYASLVDLLVEDFLSEEANAAMVNREKITAFIWVLFGALAMAVVGGFA